MKPEAQRIAIAEACGKRVLKTLDVEIVDIQSLYLDYVCLVVGIERDNFEMQRKCLRATATQRAEAFLRTIGKWEQSES